MLSVKCQQPNSAIPLDCPCDICYKCFIMKGIILAGGNGTRLAPCTKVVNKHLLPVYDKPMIYYPLSVLMLAGIREVLLISGPLDLPLLKEQFGDGSRLGMRFAYAPQPKPEGIAQALVIGEKFGAGGPVCLALGDNILFGNGLTEIMRHAAQTQTGATIFAYPVKEAERYGVVEFDARGRVKSLKEKPAKPKSPYAVPGIYFYGPQVYEYAKKLRPSRRKEYEITDLNSMFLKKSALQVLKMGRGIAWLDSGTHQSLLEAASFVKTIQERQGLMVACLEEIALNNGWIKIEQIKGEARRMGQNAYAEYLLSLNAKKD